MDVEKRSTPTLSGSQRLHVVGEHSVQKGRAVPPGDHERAQIPTVDQPRPMANSRVFGGRIAIRVGQLPAIARREGRSRREVERVQREAVHHEVILHEGAW